MIDRDLILDRWAQGENSIAIGAATGLGKERVRRVIRVAREEGDARAVYRCGSEAAGRPSLDKQKNGRAERRALKVSRTYCADLAEFGLSTTTIHVTRLGAGSADCLRIPITVSCLPPKEELHG